MQNNKNKVVVENQTEHYHSPSAHHSQSAHHSPSDPIVVCDASAVSESTGQSKWCNKCTNETMKVHHEHGDNKKWWCASS